MSVKFICMRVLQSEQVKDSRTLANALGKTPKSQFNW